MPPKLVGDAPFLLTAPQSNSDGAFTYSSSNLAVATVSGTTVTLVGAGTTTITATQAATASYASNSISATLNVTVPIVLSLDSNGVTIKYIGNPANVPANTPLFIQANVRGTGLEWFAVVKDVMKSYIFNYAAGILNTPFTPSGQTVPVPFNNIVTTLMTNLSYVFWRGGAAQNVMQYFNQPIGSWDTANVTNMYHMFSGAHYGGMQFNQPIGSWNTANVLTFDGMFYNATYFNQPIGSWNTANVLTYNGMFFATGFNQPIGSWNTTNATNMREMFRNTTKFNQPIDSWNVVNVTSFSNFRTESALSTENTPLKFR